MLSKWVGFENFKFFLHSPDTFIITRNTILYNLLFIALQAIISIALAIGINELLSKKLAKLYQSAMLLPFFLSWVVISYLVFGFLSIDKGIINISLLKFLHINPIEWYTQPAYWPFILVLCNVLKYCGYNCIVYLTGLTGIDEELYEAAILDGAGEFRIFLRIVLPLAKPALATIALFNTIAYWNDYWLPLMLINKENLFNLQYTMYKIQSNIQYLTTMAPNSAAQASGQLAKMPSETARMAMCILAIGPIIISYPFFQKYFVKGLTLGSVKG
jgi:ABC-type polysaccharide transport system permease subunit